MHNLNLKAEDLVEIMPKKQKNISSVKGGAGKILN